MGGGRRRKGRNRDGEQAGPLIFLIAGEPSGDHLGAKLMAAFKAETGGAVRFAGTGGEAMAAQGLDSLVPMAELAVMGIVEILPHALRIIRHVYRTVRVAKALRPDAIVSIDSPSFALEVSKRLCGLGVPLIHVVAPSVWAWKARRAARMARYLDHLLVLLPFEPPYFEKHGLATTFMGHPAVEAAPPPGGRARAREDFGILGPSKAILVLPGSRRGEVRRLAPIFGPALGRLSARFPELQALVPTVPTVAAMVVTAARSWPIPAKVLTDPGSKAAAFAAADAALAASGTVAVELALARVPSVIAYRLAPLTGLIARRLVKVPYASLPNLLLGREMQPERLAADCTAEALATALEPLLSDPAARAAQIAGGREVAALLDPGGEAPSQRAAKKVLELIGR